MFRAASGIGKTRLVLEASKRLKSEQDLNIVCVKNNGQLLYNDVRETINDRKIFVILGGCKSYDEFR